MHIQPNLRRVAAIHDLSGFSRTSLMAVIPILTTMGLNVCPLPTAILSNHSQYPDFSFLDLTDEMLRIIESKRRWSLARFIGKFGFELFKGVRIWLMTAFEGERHARRVGMIDRLDRGEALE